MKTIKRLMALATISLCLCQTNSFGQDAFQQGSSIISAGYGFPNLVKIVFSSYESFYGYSTSGFGPVNLKYEYAVSDKFGIGLSIGYVNYKVSWSNQTLDNNGNTVYYAAGYKGSSFGVLARFNWHFATSDKLDPYLGGAVGYNNWSFTYFDDNPADAGATGTVSFPIPLGFEFTIGARYYFTPNIAAYAEVGWGKSIIQAGISFKFGGQ